MAKAVDGHTGPIANVAIVASTAPHATVLLGHVWGWRGRPSPCRRMITGIVSSTGHLSTRNTAASTRQPSLHRHSSILSKVRSNIAGVESDGRQRFVFWARRAVFVLKLSMASKFPALTSRSLFGEDTRRLFGEAKEPIFGGIAEFKG